MTRNDIIAGGFELAGWGIVGICIGVFFVLAIPFWIVGWALCRFGLVK